MKQKTVEKIIAMMLVMTLSCVHFILVAMNAYEIYAASFEYEKQETKVSNTDIVFDAYFITEENEKTHSYVSEMTNSELKLYIDISVLKGYLGNGIISISNANFMPIETDEIIEGVESISSSNNKIALNQISKGERKVIEIPIEVTKDEIFNIENFSKDATITLTGTFVNDKAKEIEIEKNIIVNLGISEKAETILEGKILNKVEFIEEEEKKEYIQIEVESAVKDNALPIKTTEIEVKIPELEGRELEFASVVARETEATNGDNGENFSAENYKVDEKAIYIYVENKADENKNIIWTKNSTDKYIVNLVYKIVDESEKIEKIQLETSSKLNIYNKEEQIINNNYIEEISLEEVGKNIITTEIKGDTEIAKGYMLLEESKNTNYKQNIEVNIGYSSLIKEIEINKNQEVYQDNKGKYYQATTYYNSISVSEKNLENILGEEGYILICDGERELGKLDIENTEYVLEEETTNIEIKTSEVIAEGILRIEAEKYIKSGEYKKEQIEILENIYTETETKTELTDEKTISKIELANPTLQAEIGINPNELSTVLENKNVEMRVTLKTNNNTQKLYKNPTIEIEIPKYIESININSINLFYDTELKPNSANMITNEEGKQVLILKIVGEQTKYNENESVEGMTIIVNANIVVDKTAPSITEKLIGRIINNNEELIEETTNISYSAPTGIITLNTISDYKDEEEKTTSISGEEGIGIIESEAGTKIAKETITVINNYDYTCGEMIILGRTPAEGNKDIKTNKDLGSTFTAKMVNGIKAIEGITDEDIEVYYSEKGDATQNLTDSRNEWKKDIEEYENVRSYLIKVKKDLTKGEKIVLEYEVEIPEGLEKEESTYSMFEVYYENLDGALKGVVEKTQSQVVGVSTGESINLNVELEANVNDSAEVQEGQIIQYTVKVRNDGKAEVANANIIVNIPEQADYAEYTYFDDICTYKYQTDETVKNIIETVEEIGVGETKEISFCLKVKKLSDINSNNMKVSATVISNENEFTSNSISNTIVEGFFSLFVRTNSSTDKIYNNAIVQYVIEVQHNNDNTYKNVELKCNLPQNLKFISSKPYGSENITIENNDSQITWKFDEISGNGVNQILLVCAVQNLNDDELTSIDLKVTGTCDGIEKTVESNTESFKAGKTELEVSCVSSNKSEALTEGQKVEFIINIKNVGQTVAYDTVLTDYLVGGLKRISVTVYHNSENDYEETSNSNEILKIDLGNIKPDETITVKIIARAYMDSDDVQLSALHRYTISSGGIKETIRSDSKSTDKYEITHTEYVQADNNVNNNNDYSYNNNQEIISQYSISGLAWEDENKNGLREGTEKLLSGIPVLLLDSSGTTIYSTITNENGAYRFANVNEGTYIVVFMYDTANYDVTLYKVDGDGLTDNDVIEMNLKVNKISTLCGATNAITVNSNISSIDLGLVKSKKFDLSLTKTISKITVNTSKGSKAYEYNNSILEKIEIPSKELSSSTIAVEYEITVTNNGAVAGYAKKIVDYLSSTDLKFSSELNTNWYLGTDGNLYNSTLGNTLLQPGESATLKLILTKNLSENNTGITNNMAEIYESYNDEGLEDYNSTVANKSQTENDLGHADIIIGVKTGVVLYIGIVIVTISILTLGIYILNKKVIKI